MEAAEVEGATESPEASREEPRMLAKEVIWRVVALIVVFALAVIFVMIGMKLAWIGG